jgi:hypothetical protein
VSFFDDASMLPECLTILESVWKSIEPIVSVGKLLRIASLGCKEKSHLLIQTGLSESEKVVKRVIESVWVLWAETLTW